MIAELAWQHENENETLHSYIMFCQGELLTWSDRSICDGGQFVATVYADGAGYSDAIVLPADPANSQARVLAMAFQRTFHPPQHGIEGGGYDIALALMPLGGDDSGEEGRKQQQAH